jgi:hypothetical protein
MARNTVETGGIAVIDFSGFLDGSNKQQVADRMLESLKDIGFVYLINHGIPPDRIAKMFELVGANLIVPSGITNPRSRRRFSHNPWKSSNSPHIHPLECIIEVSTLVGIGRV